jgi:hypothetical protein
VTDRDQTLRLRRLAGLVLVVLALALVPSIVSAATEHRFGEGLGAGRAACGTWADPSALSRYRPAVHSSGCAQAIGAASRTIALRGSAAALLLVAGLSLLISGRVTRWIWAVALAAALAVVYAAAQPGGLSTPITGFLWVVVGMLVVAVVLLRGRSRRALQDDADGTAGAS